MVKRRGGFIGHAPLQAPDSPTGVTVSGGLGGDGCLVAFTAPSDVGDDPITGYLAMTSGGIGGTGTSSPVTVDGLTTGSATTFSVWAINDYGYSSPSAPSDSFTPPAGRAIFAGGDTTSGGGNTVNVIEFFSLASTGNAADFGDLTEARKELGGGGASSTRGIIAGGRGKYGEVSPLKRNTIDYITIASAGNATDFGDLTVARQSITSLSNATRAVSGGGEDASDRVNVMDYVSIASTGNAIDFGDLSEGNMYMAAGASKTRGLFAGGNAASAVTDEIQYITIASTGNTTDFGDTTNTVQQSAMATSNTRACIGGGNSVTNVINYVTIASTGDGTDFGDLTVARKNLSATSDKGSYAVWMGGETGSGLSDVIDYVTISSTGDAADWGDLSVATDNAAGLSNNHGGL